MHINYIPVPKGVCYAYMQRSPHTLNTLNMYAICYMQVALLTATCTDVHAYVHKLLFASSHLTVQILVVLADLLCKNNNLMIANI